MSQNRLHLKVIKWIASNRYFNFRILLNLIENDSDEDCEMIKVILRILVHCFCGPETPTTSVSEFEEITGIIWVGCTALLSQNNSEGFLLLEGGLDLHKINGAICGRCPIIGQTDVFVPNCPFSGAKSSIKHTVRNASDNGEVQIAGRCVGHVESEAFGQASALFSRRQQDCKCTEESVAMCATQQRNHGEFLKESYRIEEIRHV